jgi:hypothetical protein
MASEPSEGERVGAFAAAVLEDLYTAVYGERPVGVRSWCDDGALVLLLRLAGPAPFGEPREESGTFPCEAIPELLATAVRVQAGRELGAGGFNMDLELGLVTFVFRLPPDAGGEHADAAPSWDSVRLSPFGTPGSGGRGGAERDHLRLVRDDRAPGSVPR